MKKMKVCCFCEKWGSGGIESFLSNMIQYIDLNLVEMHIVAADLEQSVFTGLLQEHGIRFIELSGNLHQLPQNFLMFWRLLQAEHYDAVHLNIYQGVSLCYAWLAQRAGVPVRIAHGHNTALRKSPARCLKQLVHNAAKCAFTDAATDLWACSSDAAAFLFSTRGLSQQGFSLIPNGVNTARFCFNPAGREATRQKLGLVGQFVIGNVGRLSYQKNQEFLLDAFSVFLNSEPKSKLLLVGTGEELETLKNRAEKLHLHDAVIWYGSSHHIEELLWAMDLFVFPSWFEGLPVTLVEAQAAGLPILCSDKITKEAHLTPLVQVLPLSAGADGWAQAMLEWRPPLPRQQAALFVRRAGFDMIDVAERIQKGYQGAPRDARR